MKSIKKIKRTFVIFAFIYLFSVNLFPAEQNKNGEEFKLPIKTSISYETFGKADFKDTETSLKSRGILFDFDLTFLNLSFSKNYYSWLDAKKTFLTDKPWEGLTSASLGTGYYQEFSEKLGFLLALSATSNFEKEMKSNSFGYVFLLGGDYSPNQDIGIFFGGGYSLHPLHNSLFPMIEFSFGDESEPGFSLSLGSELKLRYRVNKKLLFSTSYGSGGSNYLLADDSKVEEKGYVEFADRYQDISLKYSPKENISFTFETAYRFKQEMTIYNNDEDKIASYDIDNVFSSKIGILYNF